MSTLIDIIGAAIIVGIVLLTIFGLMVNLNTASYNKAFSVTAQTNTVTLARIIEYDLRKIGFHYVKPLIAMVAAKPESLAFKADLLNDGVVRTVKYYISSTAVAGFTKNPRDRILYRIQDGVTTAMNLGVTSLAFKYYNKDGYSTSTLDSIKSILVDFTIESPAPVDTTYATISWEKKFYPKNL